MRVFVSTGEVSGDLAGAHLVHRLRERVPAARIAGIGGHRLAAAGATIIAPTSHLGIVGLTEVCSTLPALLRVGATIRRHIRQQRPDVAILIGNDLFNVVLARWLRSRGVPVVAYFPPQFWVWRRMLGPIARSFDLVLASFPDEAEGYARAADPARVRFIGHYLCDELAPREAAPSASLAGTAPRMIGLLPGSRGHEVRTLTPVLLDAASDLLGRDPSLRFVLPVADAAFAAAIEGEVQSRRLEGRVQLATDGRAAMRTCDVVLLASGTASLEATLLGVPMVILYKVSALSYAIIRACIATGVLGPMRVGLPNLILDSPTVPELLQWSMTPGAVADEAWRLLSDASARETMRRALRDARARIAAPDTLTRAVDLIVAAASARPLHAPAMASGTGSTVQAAADLHGVPADGPTTEGR